MFAFGEANRRRQYYHLIKPLAVVAGNDWLGMAGEIKQSIESDKSTMATGSKLKI